MKKLAMIGCGGIGAYHLEHFLAYEDVQLVGFCDLIEQRAQDFAARAGGAAFTSYTQMYDQTQPDMVFICIPPTEHGQIELETIRRGIHMFVEKPVTLDLPLAERIRDAAQAAGIITAAGFQCRYSSLVAPTQTFTQAHPVVYVQCARMGGIPAVQWWRNRATSGGQIVEQTIHNFDIVRYALGDPIEVCTFGTRGFVGNVPDYDTEDLTTTIVRFENGALGTFSTGCYAEGPGCCENKIVFSAKDCRLDYHLLDKVVLYDSSAKEEEGASVVKGDGRMRGSNEGVVTKGEGDTGPIAEQTFLKAVLTGDPSQIRSPYSDGIKSLAFTLACNESMAKGGVVRVRTF